MDGRERIQRYIDRAFEGIGQSSRVLEAKEALCADLMEKYQAQVERGCPPEIAYQEAISSIGDIFELVDSMVEEAGGPPQKDRRAASLARAVPYLLIGTLLLFGIISLWIPMGEKASRVLPYILLGAAVSGIVVWFSYKGRKEVATVVLRRYRILLCIFWGMAVVLAVLALFSSFFSRVGWLIPVAAISVHQLVVTWVCYHRKKG